MMKRYWLRWLAPTGVDCTECLTASYEALLKRIVFLEDNGASDFLVVDDQGMGVLIG